MVGHIPARRSFLTLVLDGMFFVTEPVEEGSPTVFDVATFVTSEPERHISQRRHSWYVYQLSKGGGPSLHSLPQ